MDFVFKEPISKSEARKALDTKSVLICPDTCVLLRLVSHEQKDQSGLIKRLREFGSQLSHIEKLLGKNDVGWIVPNQVKREFESKPEKILKDLDELNKITENSLFRSDALNAANSSLKKEIRKLIEIGEKNLRKICEKAHVLEDENMQFIHDAWETVHQDIFPNHQKQQMKDSVILQNLLDFAHGNDAYGEHDKILGATRQNIYFWTFDKFDEPSTREEEEVYKSQKEQIKHRGVEIINSIFQVPATQPMKATEVMP